MPIILDQALYNRVKREADKVYDRHSAYKSMYIQRQYKLKGGEYGEDGKPRNLDRWKREGWRSIGEEGEYPTYRPSKRISGDTPLTADEIDPKQAKEQIALKQKIKGSANLPKFKAKGLDQNESMEGGGLYKITDYTKKQAKRLGVQVFPSDNPKKKIEVYDKNGLFMFYGGDSSYSDYPSYIKSHGKEYADKRRRLYRIRHKKEIENEGSRGWFISKLLW